MKEIDEYLYYLASPQSGLLLTADAAQENISRGIGAIAFRFALTPPKNIVNFYRPIHKHLNPSCKTALRVTTTCQGWQIKVSKSKANSLNYQTVWQLAHKWVDADPYETDNNAISPKLREHINRLMLAIRNRKISVRTRKQSIFIDDSVISLIVDTPHYLKTLNCLLKDAINKAYLDSLYVKREEVIDLGSVALSAKMHISDELACFKLGGFILPAHKIAQHKTSCQLPSSIII